MQEFYGSLPEVKYFVHVYNIAGREFFIQRPLIPKLKARACPAGERYIKVTSLRHPYLQLDHEDNDVSTPRFREHSAERIAQDICNPESLSLDQNVITADAFNLGGNLSTQGLFWSKNDPPTEEELKAVEKRLEIRYQTLLDTATALEKVNNGRDLYDRITPEWHAAADYFGIETSWHQKRTKKAPEVSKVECPNCGEPIKPGAPFHFVEGVACVNDWQRAVAAGVKKKSDVPEDFQWWKIEEPVSHKEGVELVPSYMSKKKV
jgi:hypothetical protein